MLIIESVGIYSDYANNIAVRFFANLDNQVKIQLKEDGYTGDIDVDSRDTFGQSDLIIDIHRKLEDAD